MNPNLKKATHIRDQSVITVLATGMTAKYSSISEAKKVVRNMEDVRVANSKQHYPHMQPFSI